MRARSTKAVIPEVLRCPRCRALVPIRQSVRDLEAPAPAPDRPPSPVGEYTWGGRRVRYDYARIAARLGQVPDGILAEEIGCDRTYVWKLRRSLGIPSPPLKAGRADHLLGKMPDVLIAKRLGMDAATLRRRRRRLGIPKCSRREYEADRRLRAYVEDLERALNS